LSPAEQAASQPAQQEPFVSHLPPRPAAPAAPYAAAARPRRGSLLQRLVALPAAAVRTSLSLALGMLNVGVSLVGFVAQRALPPPVLRRLQGARLVSLT